MAGSKKPVAKKRAIAARRPAAVSATGIAVGKLLDTDYEARPNVRVTSRKTLTKKELLRFRQLGQRVLAQLKSNIRSNMQGRWTPIQYDYEGGPSTGELALQGTEDQWMLDITSSRRMQIRPKQKYAKRWRGHVQGMTIRRKPGGPLLGPIPAAAGPLFVSQVKLPKRDPRPTISQLTRLAKEQ